MSVFRNPNLGVCAVAEASGETWTRNLGRSSVHLCQPRPAKWWTGLHPTVCPGFKNGKLYSLPIPNLSTCSRKEVQDYFDNTWTLSELLFSALIGEEAFYRPPYHAIRHPLIFYFVHPSVLYVNKLRVAGLREIPINTYFETLFETGVDEMSWDDMSKNEIEWPSVDDAIEYRREAYAAVRSVIQSHPDLADGHAPILQDHPLWALFMGFEHERIHLETSSVLMRELPVHLVSRPLEWPDLARQNGTPRAVPPTAGKEYPQNQLIAIDASEVQIGKPQNWPTYGWDNEYGLRKAQVKPFQVSEYLITNGEFWQFVADGGYASQQNWTETGWSWRSFRNVKWPTFWVQDGPAGSHQFRLRTCFELIDMQWDWPAVVNYHEATAYCIWRSRKDGKQYRLLTEAEHHALRKYNNIEPDYSNLVAPEPSNVNLRQGSESSVLEAKNEKHPLSDVFGNVWQWCEDQFNPLPGSKVHPYYEDFSSPCYDGRHQMIMGGSFISTGDEASIWARFHFRPHFFQHAGFRIVYAPGSDGAVVHLTETAPAENPYETESIFNEYMTLHFGAPEMQMPFKFGPENASQFPQRCAELLISWCQKLGVPMEKAIDLGCSVGGSTFKLAQSFENVVGIDFSQRFIDAANALKNEHKLEYSYVVEAEIKEQTVAEVNPALCNRVTFIQGDACAVSPDQRNFDAVLMANLLCRLPNPQACLEQMWAESSLLKPGGLLLMVSPYTWMQKFTARDKWFGGYVDESGAACFSEKAIKELLAAHFELLHTEDIPLVIREHYRKYQYIVPQAMLWRRR
jgi:5-histidylcysteine sulfoxide synthase/putative 4-mercaptohistidine N1-methyltranferase